MIRRRLQWLAVLSVAALAVPLLAQQADPPPPQNEPAAQAVTPSAVDEPSGEPGTTEGEGESEGEVAHRAVEKIVGVSQTHLTTVAVVVGVAALMITVMVGLATLFVTAVFSWISWQHKKIQESAKTLAELQGSFDASWGRLDQEFDSLPQERWDVIAGADDRTDSDPFEDPAAEQLRDFDALLLLADRLRISLDDPRAMAARWVHMARYWRVRRKFQRSLLRVNRALDLDPNSADAKMHKAMTLSAGVADVRWSGRDSETEPPPPLTAAQHVHLREARSLLRTSDQLRGGPSAVSLQALAFIFDELADYPRAIQTYELARTLLEGKTDSHSEQDRELITYNLAGSLCMAEHYEEALAELAELIGKGPHLQDAVEDPQFAALREERRWKRKFQKLVDEDQRWLDTGAD